MTISARRCGRNRSRPALKKRVDAGEVTSGQLFGTRKFLQHNYLYRIMAALQSEGAVEKQGRGFVAR